MNLANAALRNVIGLVHYVLNYIGVGPESTFVFLPSLKVLILRLLLDGVSDGPLSSISHPKQQRLWR